MYTAVTTHTVTLGVVLYRYIQYEPVYVGLNLVLSRMRIFQIGQGTSSSKPVSKYPEYPSTSVYTGLLLHIYEGL